MHFLQLLRQARHITCFVLVWFVLSLGVAVASPLLNPQSTELICSGSGVMKVLVKNADGSSTEVASRMLDCPLCASVAAPPPLTRTVQVPIQPLGLIVPSIPVAHAVARTAAPLPARGPPAFS